MPTDKEPSGLRRTLAGQIVNWPGWGDVAGCKSGFTNVTMSPEVIPIFQLGSGPPSVQCG